MKKFDLTLYLVAGKGDLTEEAFLQRVEDACQGGVTLVQLREKGMDGGPLLALAGKVKKITDRYQVPLLIDDRVDVAFACRAAGVHLGQSDLPPEEARKILGGDAIIGVTVKTLEQGKAAVAAGADYFGVGAVFPTSTKKEAVHTPLEKIEEICRTFPVPCVAIGGISLENVNVLSRVPIHGIAVVSAIMGAERPKEAARALREKVEALPGWKETHLS